MPATSQTILGRQFNSITKRVNTAEQKRLKYRLGIAVLLATDTTTKKRLEKIHCCLNYVAGVEPFGRPFLANLTSEFVGMKEDVAIKLSPVTRIGLEIWDQILCQIRVFQLTLY